jgi:hypothetical protein
MVEQDGRETIHNQIGNGMAGFAGDIGPWGTFSKTPGAVTASDMDDHRIGLVPFGLRGMKGNLKGPVVMITSDAAGL